MPKDFGTTPGAPQAGTIPMPNAMTRGTVDELPPHKPNDMFVLAHHPMNWDVVDGELLPKLRNFPISAGVNAVDARGNANITKGHAMGEGWTLLDPDTVGQYAVGTRVKKGVRWHRAWVTLRHQFGRVARNVVDHEAYNTFRRQLMAEGFIKPPTPEALAMFRDRLANRVTTRESRADTAYGKRMLETSENALDDLDSARMPGEKPARKKGLLTGSAAADRKAVSESDDIEALTAALAATNHVTVEREIRKRLEKLGA